MTTLIFNTNKTNNDYQSSKIFLNPPAGLVDTINKRFSDIWDLYKEMKSLDWDENEFDYTQCISDFETAPGDMAEFMMKTIMWQWEADSVVSRAPLSIIAPFNPATEVWAAEQRISDNEQTHANTYSEIVRMGTRFPNEVIQNLLDEADTFRRLDTLNETLTRVYRYSAKTAYEISIGGEWDEHEAMKNLLIYYFAALCLERIQFMASFAITFTICKTGLFQPIGMAVKKIAQDELEVHCEYRKLVISEILKTEQGKKAFEEIKGDMQRILVEVTESEIAWTKALFNGKSLIGTNDKIIIKWVLFNVKDVARFMGFDMPGYNFPKDNPIPYMEEWLNMNNLQAAPQEQDLAQYKMNITVRDDDSMTFDIG